MRSRIAILCFAAIPGLCSSQPMLSRRNAHWAFQRNILSFSGGTGLPLADTLPVMGHACISDTAGQMLGWLGSNASNQSWGVFDSTGALVPGFPSSLYLSSAGYHPAAFIPKPGDPDSTHLFFIGRPAGTSASRAGLLTMRLHGGWGQAPGIHPGIRWLSSGVGVCQLAVPTADGDGYWLVVQPLGGAEFHAHRLDADGASPFPVISAAGPVRGESVKHGHLVATVAGHRFVASYRQVSSAADTMRIELFSFDAAAGTVSHAATLPSRRPEGLAFSLSGRFLYVLEHLPYWPMTGVRVTLVQYDTEASDIASTRAVVHEQELPNLGTMGVRNQLLLGIDGRIYRSHESSGSDTLGVIMEPDLPSGSCGYDHHGMVCFSATWSLPVPVQRYIDTPGIVTRAPHGAGRGPAVCWPQPLAELGTLSHQSLHGPMLLEWYDARVRLMRRETVVAADGRAPLNATDLPAGCYLLRVTTPANEPLPMVRVVVGR